MQIKETDFGQDYHLITIENKNGVELSVSDLGARIVSLKALNRELVWGFESAHEYLDNDLTIGAMIGRTAGRIANGRFDIAGKTYQVSQNSGPHNLHGGMPGFESAKWEYTVLNGENEASVLFRLTSPDGTHGFPGNLEVEVRHTLTSDNLWRVTTRGVTDEATLFNPTNHVYFNLSGDLSETIDQHSLYLNSNSFAPIINSGITDGTKADVSGTPFDFQQEKKIVDFFNSRQPQSEIVDGIDHPFFFKQTGLRFMQAKLTSPDEKLAIELFTDRPTVVLFSGNFGKDYYLMRGKKVGRHQGLTFETQFAPGAERFSSFGNIVLPADFPKETITEYKINFKE